MICAYHLAPAPDFVLNEGGRFGRRRKARWWPPTWRAGTQWRRSIARRRRPGRPNLAGPHRRAATDVDQCETACLVCASEYRTLECAAIPAAFETVWIARLVFLRSCAGGCVPAVDFAPLAPSLFAILRTGDRPRLAAYSLPSIDATCGGSRSRYGRPTPSSFSCASTHFHSTSLAANRCRRVSPLTLTRSMASPWP